MKIFIFILLFSLSLFKASAKLFQNLTPDTSLTVHQIDSVIKKTKYKEVRKIKTKNAGAVGGVRKSFPIPPQKSI